MSIIHMESVCKSFGENQVLSNVTLDIAEGEIFGLLGPSGAGKTTVIKLLIGVLTKTKGAISVLNKAPEQYDANVLSSLGIALDTDGFYERLTCYDNLKIYARIHAVQQKKERIHSLLEQVGLSKEANKTVAKLSKGMRQRLSFARAILHAPKIVFLDEPTNGLDPTTTRVIHHLMEDLRNDGITIFLTTHNMSEAQQMCDRIALLHEGHIVESGTPKEICLRHCTSRMVDVELIDGTRLVLESKTLVSQLSEKVGYSNEVMRIHSNEPTLEDVFIRLTGKELA